MIDCAGEPIAIVGLVIASLAVIGFAVYTIKLITNRLAFKSFEKWRDRVPDPRQTNKVQFFPGMTVDEMRSAIKATPCPVSIFLPFGHESLLSQSKRRYEHLKIGNSATVRGPLKLCGITMGQLEVENIGELHLEKCKIGTLLVSGAHPDYRITDCMIGWFAVQEMFPVQHLEWNKGYLGQFDLRGWPRENPFVGDVSIRGVKFSTDTKKYNSQWARDTRSALNKIDNAVAAGLFHGHALRLNRTRERWPSKCVEVFYKLGCDYGNSIGLPAFWFLLSVLAIFLLAFAVDTHVDGDTVEAGASVRWQKQLAMPSCEAKALRAVTYAFQSINPLSLITSKPVVFVSEWWAAYLSGFGGLCAAVAFGLFLVSVRRRFKLD